jgi:hypothetical protein
MTTTDLDQGGKGMETVAGTRKEIVYYTGIETELGTGA